MDSILLENLLGDRKNSVLELSKGCEWANQLKSIIDEPFGNDRSVEADHLIRKILRSFTDTISILNSRQISDPIPPSAFSDGLELESSMNSSALKDESVFSYKRKKSASSVAIIPTDLIATDLPEDGYEWRKCGRIEILGHKYPRNYFRCTSKHRGKGCHARKQVQRLEADPTRYETTYLKPHTCKNPLEAPHQLILDSTTPANSCQVNDPSYPIISTKTNKPPLIIFSYLT